MRMNPIINPQPQKKAVFIKKYNENETQYQ